jgi:FkbM family methyltransferase
MIYGVHLNPHSDKVIHAHTHRKGGFEPKSVALWCELAQGGGTFIDAGAYTGLYSFLALKHGAYNVTAFEPNPECFKRLVENAATNGVDARFSARGIALWDEPREMTLDAKPNLTSAGSLMRGGRGFRVQAETLDSYGFYNVRAIKFDVERAEAKAIEGAWDTLERCKPHILIELLDGVEPIAGMLRELGYAMTPLDEAMYYFRPA